MKLIDNDDCTVSIEGYQIADTAGLPVTWTERRQLAKDIVIGYNEHAALVAVAEAAENLAREITALEMFGEAGSTAGKANVERALNLQMEAIANLEAVRKGQS